MPPLVLSLRSPTPQRSAAAVGNTSLSSELRQAQIQGRVRREVERTLPTPSALTLASVFS